MLLLPEGETEAAGDAPIGIDQPAPEAAELDRPRAALIGSPGKWILEGLAGKRSRHKLDCAEIVRPSLAGGRSTMKHERDAEQCGDQRDLIVRLGNDSAGAVTACATGRNRPIATMRADKRAAGLGLRPTRTNVRLREPLGALRRRGHRTRTRSPGRSGCAAQ